MTDKELKRLSRTELLAMLLEQVKENEKLQARLGELQAQLDEKKILIDEAGSIAEAALKLNGVFQAAEAAAAQYLDNVRRLGGEEEQSIPHEGGAGEKAQDLPEEAGGKRPPRHSRKRGRKKK